MPWNSGLWRRCEIARPRQIELDPAHDPSGPGRDHDHLVGELDRLLDAMGDEEHGLGILHQQPLEIAAELLAGHGIQRPQGLVHQDQRRIMDQRPAEGGALLHPARELMGQAAR